MNNQAAQTMPCSEEWALRSMAKNYGDGPHRWDRLDREVCERAANEIKSLNERVAALSQTAGVAAPGRYFADGPQGHFFADDLQLARDLVNLYDKDDDWTITDLRNPTGAAPAASGGEDGPIFHLRSYGDVTAEELKTLTAPQPPTAASVSERARELLADGYELANFPDVARTIREGGYRWDSIRALELRAIEQALTQPSDAQRERDLLAEAIGNAGIKCGLLRKDIEGLTGPQLLMVCDDMAQALTQQRGCPACASATESYCCACGWASVESTPHPSADAVRELVKRWRDKSQLPPLPDAAYAQARVCARELESLLSAASDHQQNAAQGGGD